MSNHSDVDAMFWCHEVSPTSLLFLELMTSAQFLSEATQGDKIACYIHYVICMVQRLFIHNEWSRLTLQEKSDYVSRLFEQEEREKISAIRRQVLKPELQDQRIKKLLDTFRSNHTKLMVSGGHVTKLFEKVSTSIFYLIHLINPFSLALLSFWTRCGTRAITSKPRRGLKSLVPCLNCSLSAWSKTCSTILSMRTAKKKA